MKSKSKIILDELDAKCLIELPILLDVLSSTGNKLGKIFSPLYNDISEAVNANMPKGLELEKKNYVNQYYPLTAYEYGREKITSLDAYFQIDNSINVIKKSGTKWLNYFTASFGFYYSKDDNMPGYYYYSINKPEITARWEGHFNNLRFYQDIETKILEFKLDIQHPEQGDSSEFIELTHSEHSVDKIEAGYNLFKTEILLPFLKSVK